ncbi:MAG: DinB family protein [Longimicrobiales bacterium]
MDRSKLIRVSAAAALFLVCTAPLAAQSADAAPSPVMAALGRDVDTVEEKLLALAEALPEETWGWRPADGVRSVGEVFMHIAADNYFIPTFAGVDAPAGSGIETRSYPSVQAYEARQLSKAETIAELRTSFDHLRQVMAGTSEASLGETLDLFGTETSTLDLWVLTTTHLHEHLGQMIAYARSNDVAPPWSN